jgi:tetratricopeptide (TPR) repeat protein
MIILLVIQTGRRKGMSMIALGYKLVAFHLLGTYYTALIYEEMKHYKVAFKIRQLYCGENHLSVGDSYLAIGMAYQTRGDAYKAISYYNHATDTYKVCLGSNSLQYAKVLFYSGVNYLESRDLETALECFNECLHIRRNSSNQKRINCSTNNNDNNSSAFLRKYNIEHE